MVEIIKPMRYRAAMEDNNAPLMRAIDACKPPTQTELARRIGATVQQVNTWKVGTRPIPVLKAVAIEAQTGVPAEQLNPKVAAIRGSNGQ